jgi:hypothetical protein
VVQLFTFLIFWGLVPWITYGRVLSWTHSQVAAWLLAVLSIPSSAFVYLRVFERIKHGRWNRRTS